MDDNNQPQLKPFFVSVAEAARLTDAGESTIWDLLAKGELTAVKDGARTKILMASIERHVATRPKAKFLKPRRRAIHAARRPRPRESLTP
jgi:excisionase family DNA binding protein